MGILPPMLLYLGSVTTCIAGIAEWTTTTFCEIASWSWVSRGRRVALESVDDVFKDKEDGTGATIEPLDSCMWALLTCNCGAWSGLSAWCTTGTIALCVTVGERAVGVLDLGERILCGERTLLGEKTLCVPACCTGSATLNWYVLPGTLRTILGGVMPAGTCV